MREFNKISHAYIADLTAAEELAAAAVCTGVSSGYRAAPCGQCKNCSKAKKRVHPDIIYISRLKDKSGNLKKEIVVDQIRGLKKGDDTEGVYIAPNEAPRKVYIINDADTMNHFAQNAFLQILEEPPPHVVFILAAANPAALLPTVRSRCIQILPDPARHTHDYAGPDSSIPPEITDLAIDFSNSLCNNIRLTKLMFSLEKLGKTDFAVFINVTRGYLSQKLSDASQRQKAIPAGDLLTEAAEMLDLNVNPGHISGMLCARLID